MTSSTIALIIMAVAVVCFATEIIPLPITAVCAALAMALFGVIPYSTAFAGFANDVTLMIIGAMIIGEALFETGVAQSVGKLVLNLVGANEKRFIVVCVLVSAILSAFLSNTAVVAMMLPVVAATAAASGGRITKKNTYMAIGFAANIGGGMTIVGSTPNAVGQGLLADAGLETMSFFDLTWGSLPRLAFIIIFYLTFGYKLQKKIFNFEDAADSDLPDDVEVRDKGPVKKFISVLILVLCVVGFCSGIWTVGTVSMVCGMLCVITGCLDCKTMFKSMDWTAVWVLAGSLGFAAGMSASGAGTLIANTILGWFGGSVSCYVLMIIFTVLGGLLGNIMSSSAGISILGPIAIYLCSVLGYDAKAMMMVIIWSLNMAFLTPIGTPPITMTLQAGYRFTDYTKAGALLFIGCTVVSCLSYPLFFNIG